MGSGETCRSKTYQPVQARYRCVLITTRQSAKLHPGNVKLKSRPNDHTLNLEDDWLRSSFYLPLKILVKLTKFLGAK